MDDYYYDDDDEDYELERRKKRKGTSSTYGQGVIPDISTLPPINTLKPEELKNFTKEEIVAYLNSQGIYSTAESKPALKQQLRQVLSDLEKRKAGIATPPTSDPGLLSAQDDGKQCEDCGSKKANKECNFRRCKGCCNKNGFQCGVHASRDKFTSLADGSVVPTTIKSNMTNLKFHNATLPGKGGPMSSPPQAFFSFGTTLPNRSTNKASTSLPPSPPLFSPGALRTPNSITSSSPQLGRALTSNQINQPAVQALVQQRNQQGKKTRPQSRNLSFVECPSCGQQVSFIGTSFFTHINKCDPQLADSVLFQHNPSPDSEDAYEIIQFHALQRYSQNLSFLSDLFAHTSADDLMDDLRQTNTNSDVTAFDKATIDNKMHELQTQIDVLSKDTTLEKLQLKSRQFFQHLKKLRECTSLEELDRCSKGYTADFPTIMEPREDTVPKTKTVLVNL